MKRDATEEAKGEGSGTSTSCLWQIQRKRPPHRRCKRRRFLCPLCLVLFPFPFLAENPYAYFSSYLTLSTSFLHYFLLPHFFNQLHSPLHVKHYNLQYQHSFIEIALNLHFTTCTCMYIILTLL